MDLKRHIDTGQRVSPKRVCLESEITEIEIKNEPDDSSEELDQEPEFYIPTDQKPIRIQKPKQSNSNNHSIAIIRKMVELSNQDVQRIGFYG